MGGSPHPDSGAASGSEGRAESAAEGMSLRAYLSRLATKVSTPAERAARAQKAKEVLHDMNGYDPTPAEERELDAELDRRLGRDAA